MRAFEGKRAAASQEKKCSAITSSPSFSALPYRVAFVLVLVRSHFLFFFANFHRDWLALQKIIAVTFYNLLKKYISWSKE